jgi:hypothetical protein
MACNITDSVDTVIPCSKLLNQASINAERPTYSNQLSPPDHHASNLRTNDQLSRTLVRKWVVWPARYVVSPLQPKYCLRIRCVTGQAFQDPLHRGLKCSKLTFYLQSLNVTFCIK